jgi:hypothetical protein
MVLISQARVDLTTVGSYTGVRNKASGGFAIAHAMSTTLEIKNKFGQDYVWENPNGKTNAEKGKQLGHRVKMIVHKSIKEVVGQEICYYIKYHQVGDNSIWREYGVFDFIQAYELIKKSGAWWQWADSIKEDLKTLPYFNQLVNYIIDEDWNHYNLIESDFLKVPDWNRGYLTMFEGDSLITILKNDEKIIENVTLEDFTNQVDSWCTDDDEENQDLDSLEIMKDLISKNEKHLGNPDSLSWGKNNEGCYFLEGYFRLPAFETFVDESRNNDEYNTGGQLSVYFDDISDWKFYIETEDFQFGYLTFVNWSQCEQFRNSAFPCKFVQLFYKGEILIPEELRYRDKGITLSYEDETLDCLVNI